MLRLRVFRHTGYQIATPSLAAKAKRAEIYTDSRFSDHAPLIIDYSGRL